MCFNRIARIFKCTELEFFVASQNGTKCVMLTHICIWWDRLMVLNRCKFRVDFISRVFIENKSNHIIIQSSYISFKVWNKQPEELKSGVLFKKTPKTWLFTNMGFYSRSRVALHWSGFGKMIAMLPDDLSRYVKLFFDTVS